MKTMSIHVARIKLPCMHTDAIHLKGCKGFGKIVTINVLSDGKSILISGNNEYLQP